MPFFKKRSSSMSDPSRPAETKEEIMQRRARGFIETLQKHYPRDFAKLTREVQGGDLASARLTLRGLSGIVDEGYIEPVIQQLQTGQ